MQAYTLPVAFCPRSRSQELSQGAEQPRVLHVDVRLASPPWAPALHLWGPVASPFLSSWPGCPVFGNGMSPAWAAGKGERETEGEVAVACARGQR